MKELTYKQCKLLKDSGFSQEGVRESWCDDCKKPTIRDCFDKEHNKEYFKSPSLEELIIGCGEEGFFLRKLSVPVITDKAGWSAGNGKAFVLNCSSPKEAVMKLYLVLNEK